MGGQLLYSLALPSSVLGPNLALMDMGVTLLELCSRPWGQAWGGLWPAQGLSLNSYDMNTDLRDFHLWEGGTVKLGQARPAK